VTRTVETQAAKGELNVDQAVRDRYSAAAAQPEAALCCPVEYDGRLLEILPEEIRQKDYGCGDPSRFLQQGETVLDLGSGGGKICYIAAQIVGPGGQVIGVDSNDEMLALARKYQPEIAERLGYANLEFRKGRIQDLQLNLDAFEQHLAENPVRCSSDWLQADEYARQLRQSDPLIADESIDVILSNCVLNLVRTADRPALFREMHRVLRRGGRAVVSDIVSDEDVPWHLQQDRTLWSGCISGAHREDRFLQAFEEAGFYGIEILDRQHEPWALVEGIEFRSITIRAFRGKEGPCLERNQAVVYKGPWKTVTDDDGHKLIRGQRMAVCDKTYQIYGREPYADQIELIQPHDSIPLEDAAPFDCTGTALRPPSKTKGRRDASLTVLPEGDCCGPTECC